MNVTKLKLQSPPLLAAAIWLALTASALGQEGAVVPPENSAVTQYTEPFPTAGGETDAHERQHRNVSPDRALGPRNAQRLARHGSEGRAVAELAAETTPSAEPAAAAPEGGGAAANGSGRAGSASAENRGEPGGSRLGAPFDASAADATSGPGAVLSGALGAQSGSSGLLSFLLLAAVVVALVAAIRQRRAAG